MGLPIVLTIAAACLVVGGAVGYVIHANAASPKPSAASSTISITAAGTLGTLFPTVANALVNETPGASAPLAAQQYQGSLNALATITSLHQTFDLAAAADYRLVPHLLEPTWASWEVVFASTPEALAYDPSASALAGINSTNWAAKVSSPGVVMGVANASTDPNGYNEIFVLQLEGLLLNGSPNNVYGHFFSTPPGSFAIPNPATAHVEPETQAATLLGAHQVQAFIIYQSYAVSHHLAYVALDPRVSLGSLNVSLLPTYAMASTTIQGASGSTVVKGAPVAFAVTVPLNAPNATLGDLFVHLLLSPQGEGLIAAAGFLPLLPGWSDRPAALPGLIAPDVVPLPAAMANLIGS